MLIYYILSGGHHPFGPGVMCEFNIYHGNYNLDHVQDEGAMDLIEKMIHADPERRPTVEECLDHHYFWSNERYHRALVEHLQSFIFLLLLYLDFYGLIRCYKMLTSRKPNHVLCTQLNNTMIIIVYWQHVK